MIRVQLSYLRFKRVQSNKEMKGAVRLPLFVFTQPCYFFFDNLIPPG